MKSNLPDAKPDKALRVLPLDKAGAFAALQSEILRLQGLKHESNTKLDLGLGLIRDSFPNSSFPTSAVHEFLCGAIEDTAAASGFIAGLLSTLTGDNGAVAWISSARRLFPPALKTFNIDPERFVFVDLKKEADVFWAMEETLKCNALSAVVGEINDLSFTQSRRLQLAVEQSKVTGFVLRSRYRTLPATACVSRWQIRSLPCAAVEKLPGITYPKWRVELLRIKNGKPGRWDIEWNKKFIQVHNISQSIFLAEQQAG